jgi:hypothetical protein
MQNLCLAGTLFRLIHPLIVLNSSCIIIFVGMNRLLTLKKNQEVLAEIQGGRGLDALVSISSHSLS